MPGWGWRSEDITDHLAPDGPAVRLVAYCRTEPDDRVIAEAEQGLVTIVRPEELYGSAG